MLPYLEQLTAYNAVNFDLTSADAANLTISGVYIGSLHCPSDEKNQTFSLPATPESPSGVTPGWNFNQIYPLPPGQWKQEFTSYAGNAGTFTFGFSNLMPPEVLQSYNGVIYNDSSVTRRNITDGTSNTFLFGERAKGHTYVLDPAYAVSNNSWNSGRWYDTLFSSLYPINLATGNQTAGIDIVGLYSVTATGSYHPGGANFAFCDGSVRFIRNSISSWSFSAGNYNGYGDSMPDNTTFVTVPPAVPYTKQGSYLQAKQALFGVYQQLSTRNGGEVISSESY
jgi:prepilin-type processing-associated H-X9-DG protein